MGKSILNTVIDLLTAGGIAAAPAQPNQHMLIIQTPVAAVSMEKVDMESATVLVQAIAPMKNGAERCQKHALTVWGLLREAGAECVQGKCTFDGRSAMFCVPVTAKFYGTAMADDWIPAPPAPPAPVLNVTLAGVALAYVTSFSAQQKKVEVEEKDAQGQVTKKLVTLPWEFTLEEFFPTGAQEPDAPQEPFTLQAEQEVLSGCVLMEHLRVQTTQGFRQVRKGIAASRTLQ